MFNGQTDDCAKAKKDDYRFPRYEGQVKANLQWYEVNTYHI